MYIKIETIGRVIRLAPLYLATNRIRSIGGFVEKIA